MNFNGWSRAATSLLHEHVRDIEERLGQAERAQCVAAKDSIEELEDELYALYDIHDRELNRIQNKQAYRKIQHCLARGWNMTAIRRQQQEENRWFRAIVQNRARGWPKLVGEQMPQYMEEQMPPPVEVQMPEPVEEQMPQPVEEQIAQPVGEQITESIEVQMPLWPHFHLVEVPLPEDALELSQFMLGEFDNLYSGAVAGNNLMMRVRSIRTMTNIFRRYWPRLLQLMAAEGGDEIIEELAELEGYAEAIVAERASVENSFGIFHEEDDDDDE